MTKGMIMVIMTQGVPILTASIITCPNCWVGPNIIRAMQLSTEGNAAQQYQSNLAQQYQNNPAQQYEGSAAQQYQNIAAQHSQSNAAQFQQPSHIGAM